MDKFLFSRILFFSIIGFLFFLPPSCAQSSMDPKVNITETDPPSDGYIVRGTISQDIVMNCYVENKPPELAVQWQRTSYDQSGRESIILISQDMGVSDNMKWSIEKPTAYTWRLRIKYLEVADEGNYTCFMVLTQNNNRASANRTVQATEKPTILEIMSSTSMIVKEGDFVPMRCNASGRPLPVIMWRRQGNAIFPPPEGGVRRMGSILDIPDVQYDARGIYICEAYNDVGVEIREITLTVQFAPKIQLNSPEVAQAIGYQRTLVCYIEANPLPALDQESNQVYWIKGVQRVMASDRLVIRTIIGAYGKITYEMVIRKVESGDYGEWKCGASTTLGRIEVPINLIESSVPLPDKKGQITGASHIEALLSTLLIAVCAIILSL